MRKDSYRRKRRSGFSGLALGLLLAGAMRIYSRRTIDRRPSQEGIEDPEISRAYNWVSTMPQMALARRLMAERAINAVCEGQAIDLGCGAGQLVLELSQRAPKLHVTGVDLSPDLLAAANQRADAAGLCGQVHFRLGDVADIPFQDGSLDLVVSSASLHHWSDPLAVFNEIERVLKPGGSFLIFDLRRDVPAPVYLMFWFATQIVVPAALHQVNEPMGSRNASYTPGEAAALLKQSRLAGGQVTPGPAWIILEGRKPQAGE